MEFFDANQLCCLCGQRLTEHKNAREYVDRGNGEWAANTCVDEEKAREDQELISRIHVRRDADKRMEADIRRAWMPYLSQLTQVLQADKSLKLELVSTVLRDQDALGDGRHDNARVLEWLSRQTITLAWPLYDKTQINPLLVQSIMDVCFTIHISLEETVILSAEDARRFDLDMKEAPQSILANLNGDLQRKVVDYTQKVMLKTDGLKHCMALFVPLSPTTRWKSQTRTHNPPGMTLPTFRAMRRLSWPVVLRCRPSDKDMKTPLTHESLKAFLAVDRYKTVYQPRLEQARRIRDGLARLVSSHDLRGVEQAGPANDMRQNIQTNDNNGRMMVNPVLICSLLVRESNAGLGDDAYLQNWSAYCGTVEKNHAVEPPVIQVLCNRQAPVSAQSTHNMNIMDLNFNVTHVHRRSVKDPWQATLLVGGRQHQTQRPA